MDTQIVMLTAKALNVQEVTVVGLAIFYNSGKYFLKELKREDLDYEYDGYIKGIVSEDLGNFCLDYLAGRIPPNLLMNALRIQHDSKKTQPIKFRKGKRG